MDFGSVTVCDLSAVECVCGAQFYLETVRDCCTVALC